MASCGRFFVSHLRRSDTGERASTNIALLRSAFRLPASHSHISQSNRHSHISQIEMYVSPSVVILPMTIGRDCVGHPSRVPTLSPKKKGIRVGHELNRYVCERVGVPSPNSFTGVGKTMTARM